MGTGGEVERLRSISSLGPVLAQDLRLFENEFCCPLLHVGWVAELAQHPFYQDSNLRTGVFADLPIDGDVLLDPFNEFLSEEPQLLVAHHVAGALVVGKRVIEGDLFVIQSQILTSRLRCPYVFGQPNQLIDDLCGFDSTVLW